MLSQNGQPMFSTYLKKAFNDFFLSGLGDHVQSLKVKISLEYMISGLVGVICLWITDSENIAIDEVIVQLSEIHFSNVLDLSKNI
ncbi:hypothetical protein D3C74_227470 [compost metagenome]